ncbi:MAG: FxLYD domain-containing protein [Chloroflexi bacterium]|nr:FxLYD domain-containing protein [Chloroflexota bacterium]MCL5076405.1 FxLYD domain-containing protein [Chloroflexota bacterium]
MLSSSAFDGNDGHLYIAGETYNNSRENVKSVKITARCYDAAGQLLAEGSASGYILIQSPGQNSPFKIALDYPVGWATYELSVSFLSTRDVPPSGLNIVAQSTGFDADGDYRISGEITNNSKSAVSNVAAVATIYDAAGRVLNCGYSPSIPTRLLPGRKGSFTIITSGNLADFAGYSLQVSASF